MAKQSTGTAWLQEHFWAGAKRSAGFGGYLNVSDTELIALLEKRDGPLPERSWSHASEGECRYSELYDGQTCPWCEAARRREDRETAAANPD